jgi:hypothetical protein
MAFSKEDVESIDSAIASGELTVDFGDRKISYRSIPELRKAKAHILENLPRSELEALGINRSRQRRPRAFRMNVGKGI